MYSYADLLRPVRHERYRFYPVNVTREFVRNMCLLYSRQATLKVSKFRLDLTIDNIDTCAYEYWNLYLRREPQFSNDGTFLWRFNEVIHHMMRGGMYQLTMKHLTEIQKVFSEDQCEMIWRNRLAHDLERPQDIKRTDIANILFHDAQKNDSYWTYMLADFKDEAMGVPPKINYAANIDHFVPLGNNRNPGRNEIVFDIPVDANDPELLAFM